MSVTIVTDRSRNIIWYARKGDDQSITINFVDSNLAPYDVSGETFDFVFKRFSGNTLFTLTQGNGLTNNSTSLIITFTDTQLDIEPGVYLAFLKSTNNSTQKITTWLNINFILNGETWDGETTSESEVTVNNGAITITLQITLSGGSGSGSGSFIPVDYTTFESAGFPTDTTKIYRLVFGLGSMAAPVLKNGIYYNNNDLIVYSGSNNWISWSANYGSST